MSYSGGFYQYHCKYYFLLSNANNSEPCQSMVNINNDACSKCLAKGLDSEADVPVTRVSNRPMEVYVPHVVDGTLHYQWMEVVETGDPNNFWILRLRAPRPQIPTNAPEPADFTPLGPALPVPFNQ